MTDTKTATVSLDTPIVRGDTTISEIILRKPVGGDLRGLSMNEVLNSDVGAMIKLLPRISTPGLTEPDLQRMEVDDLTSLCSEVVAFFLTRAKKESLGL